MAEHRPDLASYMQGSPNRGVFAPRNLGLYTYGWNNPVVIRDPNGLCNAPGPKGGGSGSCTGGTATELFPPETRTRVMTPEESNKVWDALAARLGRQPTNDELFAAWSSAYPDAAIGPITEAADLSNLKYKFEVNLMAAILGGEALAGGSGVGVLAPDITSGGGVLEGANFAQKTFGRMFSKGGAFAGRSVEEVAGALRSGAMKASDVPINYIVRDGNKLILNTRSAQALEAAGIPRSAWNAVNRTGNAMFEEMLTGQLQRNGLTSAGTATVRASGL